LLISSSLAAGSYRNSCWGDNERHTRRLTVKKVLYWIGLCSVLGPANTV